ncbi:MAG: tRNA dihydrouridine(20/20a) synthase DusA [Spirochaetales bacterium]|nr:tRNA dihydrouridine(20/20a) synthase DusA [Spirochaetales bacterium]
MSQALEERPFGQQKLSLAPMVDKSDRDWRWVMRRISRKTLLYTEMITAPAALRGNRDRVLGFDPEEKPLVLQLGWDEADKLVDAAKIAEDFGYDEINLNCGCPSDKVQQHDFGACLMARPQHVAHLVEAMASATSLPITVKNRIGIRSQKRDISLERYEDLLDFVDQVSQAGCRKFTVHSRIAILEGLSPRENRDIPPLQPDFVYRLKEERPDFFIEINGGYKSVEQIDDALHHVDGVMLGRVALDQPWLLKNADQKWFGESTPSLTRRQVLEAVWPYYERRLSEGASRGLLVQPLMNLFAGEPGAKAWKRHLTEALSGPAKDFLAHASQAVSFMDPKLLDS